MCSKPLNNVLQSLYEIKATMRNATNASVISRLDEAIFLLEHSLDDLRKESKGRQLALEAIGALLEKLPAIIAIVQLLTGDPKK
ncbi:MAG: hypothetical protein OEW08_09920 [Gammaproteobacteria bacterium]|nr:hypothetical protein [Gammaproteobacteria bacterium]